MACHNGFGDGSKSSASPRRSVATTNQNGVGSFYGLESGIILDVIIEMFGAAKKPKDLTPYLASPLSRSLTVKELPGRYAYVVDIDEVIYVIPDGLHVHPLILGRAREAVYAGDLIIEATGVVSEITNLSGTFQFKSQRSLCCVVEHLQHLGFSVMSVMWYCPSGSSIRQLNC